MTYGRTKVDGVGSARAFRSARPTTGWGPELVERASALTHIGLHGSALEPEANDQKVGKVRQVMPSLRRRSALR